MGVRTALTSATATPICKTISCRRPHRIPPPQVHLHHVVARVEPRELPLGHLSVMARSPLLTAAAAGVLDVVAACHGLLAKKARAKPGGVTLRRSARSADGDSKCILLP